MELRVGIVGLPNVGKSTLFNALTKKQGAVIGNFPFTTIEPNVGIVEVPDKRLSTLQQIAEAAKIVPAYVKFVDIAGLVKGASQGEGLGNKFLAHVREVDAICHVVRYFIDDNVTHVSGRVDPAMDIAVIETELLLADLQTLEKQPEPKGSMTKEKEVMAKWEVIVKLKEELNKGKTARQIALSPEEELAIKPLNLLTAKPVIYAFNISEQQLFSHAYDEKALAEEFKLAGPVITFCAKIESELESLTEDEAREYLAEAGVTSSGLERLIQCAYNTLGLITYFTAGPTEVHAWTIKKGTKAPRAAGVIHTDFEKGFIKAEVISYEDYIKYNGPQKAKQEGKLRLEGKEYMVQDGDIMEFKWNL